MSEVKFPKGYNPNRSQLQYEDDDNFPICPGNEIGQHCGHLDTHESCCDCDISSDEYGDVIPPTKALNVRVVQSSEHEHTSIMDEIVGHTDRQR